MAVTIGSVTEGNANAEEIKNNSPDSELYENNKKYLQGSLVKFNDKIYLAKRNVPSDVDLDNPYYWEIFMDAADSKRVDELFEKTGNLDELETESKDNLVNAINEAVLYTAQSLTEEKQAQARANIGAGTPYTLPQATAEAIGGVKADSAEAADTQSVRIGVDGKLYTAPGADGKSAYQYAVDGGYTGTETEFAEKLATDIPNALPNPNALTFTGAVNATYDGSTAVSVEIPSGGSGGTDISLGLTSAAVGQTIKVKAIDESGKPTAWEAVDMPSGGGGSGKLETFDGMQLLASGTITNGTAAGTKTDTGVTYEAFKQWHRVVFIRRGASGQGNLCFGYGYENNLGFRNGNANMSVTYEHIDGYIWKYHCHATDTAAYAAPLTSIDSYTKTLWAPSFGSTSNCNIDDGYIDIRCGIQDQVVNGEYLTFTDENTFKIKNWAALTADVSWYIYGLTKEAAQ